jgi:signal transduction histidine kinase
MFTAIRWRLARWNVAVFGLILLLVCAATYAAASRRLPTEVDRELENRGATFTFSPRAIERGEIFAAQSGYRGGYFFIALGPNGEVLANPQQVTLPALPAIAAADGPTFFSLTINGEEVRFYARPIPPPTASTPPPAGDRRPAPATIIVGQSLVPTQNALRRLLIGLIVAGIGGILLLFLGAWFLAGRALVPIERAFRTQQGFIADASHELRTPLTVLRSSADLLDRHRDEPLRANGELFDDLRDGLARLERLATDLLTLARSDLGEQTLAVAPLDLGPFAADVARRTGPLARAHELALTCELSGEDVPIEADPDRLHQVVLILLDNAIAHTPPGGRITVAVGRRGGEALLEVRDTGEGIPPEGVARIFDRFYRADRSRSRAGGGAGLGLAIAKALVESHGGTIALISTLDSGTTVTVTLPLVDRPPTLAGRLGQLAARAVGRERASG